MWHPLNTRRLMQMDNALSGANWLQATNKEEPTRSLFWVDNKQGESRNSTPTWLKGRWQASRPQAGGPPYTEVRLEPWLVACIATLATVQGLFMQPTDTDTGMGLILVALYTMVSTVLSNPLLMG